MEEKTTKILFAMKVYLKMRVENLRKKGEVLMEKHALEMICPHKYIIDYIGSNKDEVNLAYKKRLICIFYMNISTVGNYGNYARFTDYPQ